MMRLIQRIGCVLASPERKLGGARGPALDWRVTLKRRIVVAAGLMAIWAVGIQAKLVYLQVFERTELEARARAQQQSTRLVPATR